MSTFTASLQSFFTTYLIHQRAASPHTIAAYRDTFRLLLKYLKETTGTAPDALEFTDLNVDALTAFLQFLEADRATASGPATPDWQQSTPSSPTPRMKTPSTPT